MSALLYRIEKLEMPWLDEPMIIWAGVPVMTRVKILTMKIEAAKKSVHDYVEPRSFNFSGGGW